MLNVYAHVWRMFRQVSTLGETWSTCRALVGSRQESRQCLSTQVITSVRGGTDDNALGRRMCRRDGIAVPLVIHHKPRASISPLVCTNLCKDEVASAMVNLTQGQVCACVRVCLCGLSPTHPHAVWLILRAVPCHVLRLNAPGPRRVLPDSWAGVLEMPYKHCCRNVSRLPSQCS